MPIMLHGRYGAFKPRNDRERAKASRQAQTRRAETARTATWLEKHKACANGCGKPVAFYDSINYALRFGGCCSADCEAAMPACERST